jgi:hypothetical protein
MERNNRPTPTILIELVGTSTRTPVFVSIFPWKKTWKAMGKAWCPLDFPKATEKKHPEPRPCWWKKAMAPSASKISSCPLGVARSIVCRKQK